MFELRLGAKSATIGCLVPPVAVKFDANKVLEWREIIATVTVACRPTAVAI